MSSDYVSVTGQGRGRHRPGVPGLEGKENELRGEGPSTNLASTGTDNTVTYNLPDTTLMHVGDLDSTSVKLAKGEWSAEVNIVVHDSSHNPVTSSTVSGTLIQNGTTIAVSWINPDGDGTGTTIQLSK